MAKHPITVYLYHTTPNILGWKLQFHCCKEANNSKVIILDWLQPWLGITTNCQTLICCCYTWEEPHLHAFLHLTSSPSRVYLKMRTEANVSSLPWCKTQIDFQSEQLQFVVQCVKHRQSLKATPKIQGGIFTPYFAIMSTPLRLHIPSMRLVHFQNVLN